MKIKFNDEPVEAYSVDVICQAILENDIETLCAMDLGHQAIREMWRVQTHLGAEMKRLVMQTSYGERAAWAGDWLIRGSFARLIVVDGETFKRWTMHRDIETKER